MGDAAVTAGVGRAASLGVLSVPQGWTSAAPAFSQVASALPAGSGLNATSPVVPGGPAAPFGPPMANTAEGGGKSSPLAARYYVRPAMVQRPVYAGYGKRSPSACFIDALDALDALDGPRSSASGVRRLGMLLAQLREISTDSVNERVDVLARRVADVSRSATHTASV